MLEPNESYANFLARLEATISCTVIGEEIKKQLEKLLAYEDIQKEMQELKTAIKWVGDQLTDVQKQMMLKYD